MSFTQEEEEIFFLYKSWKLHEENQAKVCHIHPKMKSMSWVTYDKLHTYDLKMTAQTKMTSTK